MSRHIKCDICKKEITETAGEIKCYESVNDSPYHGQRYNVIDYNYSDVCNPCLNAVATFIKELKNKNAEAC